MDESRVDRLLRLAEEAIAKGEYEQGFNFANVASIALDARRVEIGELEKIATADDN